MAASGYDESKFTELVLYCASLLEADGTAGATKLNKLLYFAEFDFIRRTGSSITGAEFQRLEHGPAPRTLVPTRDRLVRSGRAELRHHVDGRGYRRDQLVAVEPPDRTRFTAAERETIEAAADRIRSMTAVEVSELSHRDPGWLLTTEGETIPASTAYLTADAEIPDRLRPEVAARAEALAAEHASRALG